MTFEEFLLKRATEMRNDAAFSGSTGDGGASRLLDIVAAYTAGTNNVPLMEMAMMESHKNEYLKQTDPDYALYQKLKSRFEG